MDQIDGQTRIDSQVTAARLRVDISEITIRVERARELWQATHLLEGNHIQITLALQVGGWARGQSPLLVKIE